MKNKLAHRKTPEIVRNYLRSAHILSMCARSTYLLCDKNLVHHTDAGHGDALLFAQHGRRHQDHRYGQLLPTWRTQYGNKCTRMRCSTNTQKCDAIQMDELIHQNPIKT